MTVHNFLGISSWLGNNDKARPEEDISQLSVFLDTITYLEMGYEREGMSRRKC